jgi:hypothetical protein
MSNPPPKLSTPNPCLPNLTIALLLAILEQNQAVLKTLLSILAQLVVFETTPQMTVSTKARPNVANVEGLTMLQGIVKGKMEGGGAKRRWV